MRLTYYESNKLYNQDQNIMIEIFTLWGNVWFKNSMSDSFLEISNSESAREWSKRQPGAIYSHSWMKDSKIFLAISFFFPKIKKRREMYQEKPFYSDKKWDSNLKMCPMITQWEVSDF